jgi:hypothetical protein
MKFLCLLVFIPCLLNAQTCIVAKKTKKAIYLGADSRVIKDYLYTDGSHKQDTTSICKIYSSGKHNFSLSGAYMAESFEYIIEASKLVDNFDSLIKRYSNAFRPFLLERFTKAAMTLPLDSFYSYVSRRQPYINNAIFFGQNGDSLFLGMIWFTVTLNKESKIIAIDSYSNKRGLEYAGHFNLIVDSMETKINWSNNVPQTISSLIEIQAKASNYIEVGGNTQLVKFTKKKGLVWISKKPPCN